MTDIFEGLKLSKEKKRFITSEITLGSEPKASFYAMLLASSIIASFGLMENSTAAVIGAMLVSPLMTPILGISLGLVQGNNPLLVIAIKAELAGFLLAILIATIIGFLPFNMEVTPEMLSRTHPNLFDLMVAVSAGFAGAYAMLDERISPALPGVAIATAIVPPLANIGLCLGLGAFVGAWGSLLLFLANFFSILLVTSGLFFIVGLSPDIKSLTYKTIFKKFGWAMIGFLILVVFLTSTLVDIIKMRKRDNIVKNILIEDLSNLSYASLGQIVTQKVKGELNIFVEIKSPHLITPEQVTLIQSDISNRLGKNVNIIIRDSIAKDVSPVGATIKVITNNLDGIFVEGKKNKRNLALETTEQVLFEKLSSIPYFTLKDLKYGRSYRGNIILAEISGLRAPTALEIQDVQLILRKRLNNDNFSLMVNFTESHIYDSTGKLKYGWTLLGKMTPEKRKFINVIPKMVKNIISTDYNGIEYNDTYFNIINKPWRILIEISGEKAYELDKNDVAKIQKLLIEKTKQPIETYLYTGRHHVVGKEGVVTFQRLYDKYYKPYEKDLKFFWNHIQ